MDRKKGRETAMKMTRNRQEEVKSDLDGTQSIRSKTVYRKDCCCMEGLFLSCALVDIFMAFATMWNYDV